MENEIDLGKCCACGIESPDVRNIMTISKKSPLAGTGWGCFQCGLPMDGAIAVLCDTCLETGKEILFVCVGYPKDNNRALLADCVEDFEHDMSKHNDDQYGISERDEIETIVAELLEKRYPNGLPDDFDWGGLYMDAEEIRATRGVDNLPFDDPPLDVDDFPTF